MSKIKKPEAEEPCQPAAKGGATVAVWRKLIIFVAFSLIFVAIGIFTPLGELWRSATTKGFIERLGYWGVVVIVAAGALAPMALLPRWPLAALCGALYGIWWGGLLANFASMLGAWLQFWLARHAFSPILKPLIERYGKRLVRLPAQGHFAAIVALRAFPLSNFVATNLLAASLPLSLRSYLAATFLGMIPSTLMYGAWGYTAINPKPTNYLIMAVMLLFAAVVALVILRRTNGANENPTKGDQTTTT